ncbi:DUF6193 family natural product biosynthesis protein [Streptomyces sp. NPDC048710]|uniref:DUF6193 family natural product biosynthesis protein n=1 Tax=Streptomyces sp. NPDC048710 TaxID=3365586 RepID=UPI00371F450F
MHEYALLYPDVVRAGSLLNASQAEADRAACGLTVESTSSPGWRRVAAEVALGDRSANVLMAQRERTFSVDCWAGAVRMATGRTGDLSEVAGALHSWLRVPRVRELVAQWPFLRPWTLAEAHERGEAVPERWRQLREAAARMQNTALHELVEAAFEQPRLRVLSPGRSMHWVSFSRRAAPPICRDLPQVMPFGDGRYHVRFVDGRLQEVDSAAEAVEVIVDSLPDDAVPRPSDR